MLVFPLFAIAQTGLDCQHPISLTTLSDYCSANAQYNNSDPQQAGITWFQFTAFYGLVNVVISGANTGGGTLTSPNAKIYTDCTSAALASTNSTTGGVATLHAENLTSGGTYYIAVTGQNNGTFKLCINNYLAPSTDGKDCETANFLYNTNNIGISQFYGAGLKNTESAGTCLGGESNSTWYKWKAANNGTLVFTITPDKTSDDVDFVLYDLGTTGDCANVMADSAIRCAAGHGICAIGPNYSQTGLDFHSIDLYEATGCDGTQDGKLKYVNMIAGNNYALLINNFTSSGGMTLKFTDQNNVAGTGTFGAPTVTINVVPPTCASNKTYVFNNFQTKDHAFTWDFGPNANIINVDADFNFTVQFTTPGNHNIALTVYNSIGAPSSNTISINVPDVLTPAQPVINANKTIYCPGDVIILSTTPVAGLTYQWTGPGGFMATGPSIQVPITSTYTNGAYIVNAVDGTCLSAPGTYLPVISTNPVAAFTATPVFPAELLVPATATFTNLSTNADTYLWEFGDGSTSTGFSPQHIYTVGGTYHVKLTATNSTNGCAISVTEGDYVIKYGNVIFIPNAFTPNNDGVNDKFAPSITNIKVYHIQIFNRNGNVVFDSRDPMQPWDGNYGTQQVPVGIYYYVIDAIGLDNNTIKQAGYITLLR